MNFVKDFTVAGGKVLGVGPLSRLRPLGQHVDQGIRAHQWIEHIVYIDALRHRYCRRASTGPVSIPLSIQIAEAPIIPLERTL